MRTIYLVVADTHAVLLGIMAVCKRRNITVKPDDLARLIAAQKADHVPSLSAWLVQLGLRRADDQRAAKRRSA